MGCAAPLPRIDATMNFTLASKQLSKRHGAGRIHFTRSTHTARRPADFSLLYLIGPSPIKKAAPRKRGRLVSAMGPSEA